MFSLFFAPDSSKKSFVLLYSNLLVGTVVSLKHSAQLIFLSVA